MLLARAALGQVEHKTLSACLLHQLTYKVQTPFSVPDSQDLVGSALSVHHTEQNVAQGMILPRMWRLSAIREEKERISIQEQA